MQKQTGDHRPKATIEGTAEDVTPASSETAPASADEPVQSRASDDPAGDTSGLESEEGARAGSDGAARSAEQGAAPVRRTSRLALLAASLAGGLVVAGIVALLALTSTGRQQLAEWSGARAAAERADAAADRAEAVEAALADELAARDDRLSALETQAAQLRAGLEPLAGLEAEAERLASELDRLSELPAQTSALGVRVGAAETRLGTLAREADARGETVNSLARALDEAAAAGTSAAAVSSGLARQTDRLAALETRLEALSEEVERRSDAPDPDPGAAWRARADDRIAALSAGLEALAARAADDAEAARSLRLQEALATVRSAVDSGAPFASDLAALSGFQGAGTLQRHAETGVPTVEALLGGLEELPAAASGPAPGAMGRIVGLLGDAVQVRRVEPGSEGTNASDLERARQALRDGNPARAADIVEAARDGPEAEDWVSGARARAQALSALTELSGAVRAEIDRLGG